MPNHAILSYPIHPVHPTYVQKANQLQESTVIKTVDRKTKFPKNEKAASTRLLFHLPKKPDNRPDPRRNQNISCRVITCMCCFFCVFIFVNNCQHPLEGDVFDPEFPALPSSLALFFSGGASSFMHAFSRMFVHFPLVPAWLCFKC